SAENLSIDARKSYDNGIATVANAIFEINTTLDGLESVQNQPSLSESVASNNGSTAKAYRQSEITNYYKAKDAYNISAKDFAKLNGTSTSADLEKVLGETYNTAKYLSDAISNMISFVNLLSNSSNNSQGFTTYQNTLAGYSQNINSDLSSLTTAITSITNSTDSSQNANLDLQSAELTVTQRENALSDAKEKLSDYFIRAPYTGTIANLTLKNSDSVSASTVVASLATDKQIAEISLNEVDVAKIKTGEKASMTFDAVPDLSISGTVDEIDSIGTVSQGVVTYNVKITFDSQDERVKSAMSVSASITTDMKQDILVVPNSAIKSQNGSSYIEMFSVPLSAPTDGLQGAISKIPPTKVHVKVGISNDARTEIISGVNEGDEIVMRTILSTSTPKTTAPSLFGGNTRPATTQGNTNRTGGGFGGR
ncbi:HlyD family efflux transporter periplasmic adaptor subunit, partial [Patescibacteria group bacterium]|nr:HlyD family efflux transporter periplasmic adaptor subunit [Patescibacteria group bacterium]